MFCFNKNPKVCLILLFCLSALFTKYWNYCCDRQTMAVNTNIKWWAVCPRSVLSETSNRSALLTPNFVTHVLLGPVAKLLENCKISSFEKMKPTASWFID